MSIGGCLSMDKIASMLTPCVHKGNVGPSLQGHPTTIRTCSCLGEMDWWPFARKALRSCDWSVYPKTRMQTDNP